MGSQALGTVVKEQLAETFRGELIDSDDAGYDEARQVWNGLIDRRPALIARCADAGDVVATIQAGRVSRLPLAVRGGGHSAPGYGTCDGGIVLDLSLMNAVTVDPQARTARAGGGTTWGELDAATQEHGLAVTGGRFSTTGIGGLTLGSGSGWLERKCGLTGDNLLSAEVVTADGRVVTASADENAELFWGLRGGSGNFGVVTSFEYRLHEIGPIIYGGMLLSRRDRAADLLRAMRELMADAPDDLGGAVALISAPPAPFVPEEMRGRPAVGTVICWTGDHAEGERVVAPIREAAQAVVDLVQPMPYLALQSMLDAGGPKGVRGYMKAEFLDELSDAVIDTLAAIDSPGPMAQVLIEPMGGAISRVPDGATALGRRDVPWCYHVLSMWMDPSDEALDAHVQWARDLAEVLRPHSTSGVYLNYTSDEGDERVRSTYGDAAYARLVALKDEYDPTNLFRINQNIAPSREVEL